jgi:diguanylate cyclase (GGDEF)-like protein
VVPADNADLLKAQFEVFSKQVPLMYAIVLINAWALAFTFSQRAPDLLTIWVPTLISAVCCFRVVGWWRSGAVVPDARTAHKALMRTNQFGFILTAALVAWSLSLYPHGDAYMRGNIAFFVGITGLGVMICLQQLPSAAFIVAAVINVSFVVYFSFAGIASFFGMAINLVLVSVALLLVVTVQYRHFSAAVTTRAKLESANHENGRLANLDSLTGLSNRRHFFAQLEQDFAAAEGRRLAVGVIDLDGFKPVNDLYGHTIGDSLLYEVGQRLQSRVGSKGHIARLGGDEFALIVTDCPDDENLLELGEEICTALRTPFTLSETTVQISGSIGFSVYPELADDVHQLYERADYALYEGKETNRGHALLFSTDHIAAIEQNQQLEQLLSTADFDAELAVVFQPIVNIQSGRTVSFEALARWNSPVLGNVSPGVFIPVAERIGVISELTCTLLRKALAAATAWPEEVGLSFNLSTHDISSSDSVATIVGIILSSGIDPRRLDLEITETAMMYDFAQAKAAIEIFKILGCGMALDDFGTGYSSLSQLHALPLTKIKIDRSFVSGLHRNPASYKIVKSLLALSSDMDLDCVIEGVETSEELEALKKLGGVLVQGYYYSAPVAQSEIARFLPRPEMDRKAG